MDTFTPAAPRPFDPERHAGWTAGLGTALVVVGLMSVSTAGAVAAGAGAALLLAACFARGMGVLLFGPVFGMEVRQALRKQRTHLWRALYTLIVLGLMAVIYCAVFRIEFKQIFETPAGTLRDQARFAQIFAAAFLGVQFMSVTMMVPGLVGPLIAEDKDRRMLDFVLMTDLRAREIVFGRLFSRLAHAGGYALAALPILAAVPFFGGVDPTWILLGYWLTVVTALGVAGVAMYVSVHAPAAKRAGGQLGGMLTAYFFGTNGITTLMGYYPRELARIGVGDWNLFNALGMLCWGNPLAQFSGLALPAAITGVSGATVWAAILTYSAFHLSAFVLFGVLATRDLRRVASSSPDSGTAPKTAKASGGSRRPAVTDRPLVWKEMHHDVPKPKNWIARRARDVIVLSGLGVVLYLLLSQELYTVPRGVNGVCRMVGAIVVFVAMVAVGNFAARTFERERLKNTLDPLLLTPLSAREIIVQKFLGAWASGRHLLLWVALCWVAVCIRGAVSPVGLVLFLLAMVGYTFFASALGVWCAAAYPAGKKAAQAFGGLNMLAAFGASLVVGAVALAGFLLGVQVGDWAATLAIGFQVTFSPLGPLGLLPYYPDDLVPLTASGRGTDVAWVAALGALAGPALFTLTGVFLLNQAVAVFDRGRVDFSSAREPV